MTYDVMTGRQVLKLVKQRGGVIVRRRGSHVIVKLGTRTTTIPLHAKEPLGIGLLKAIERDLAGELGERWLER